MRALQFPDGRPPLVVPPPARPSAQHPDSTTTPVAPLRVLVVDDLAMLRALLARLLRRAGHDVVGEAGTVADAVAAAGALAPDVVLLDLHLPDGLGTDLARHLSEQVEAPRTGLVVCTSDPGAVDRAAAARAGVFAVLEKPVTQAGLDAAIRGAAAARGGAGPAADGTADRKADGKADGAFDGVGRGDGQAVAADASLPAAVRQTVRGLRAACAPGAARGRFAPPPELPPELPAPLLAQLREPTERCTCELRRAGLPVQQMLPRVKAIVRDALTAEGWTDPAAADAVVARVVRWSIEAYYDTP